MTTSKNSTHTTRSARIISENSNLTYMQALNLYKKFGNGVDVKNPSELTSLLSKLPLVSSNRPLAAVDPALPGLQFLTNGCLENIPQFDGVTAGLFLEMGLSVQLSPMEDPLDVYPNQFERRNCVHCAGNMLIPLDRKGEVGPIHGVGASTCPSESQVEAEDWYPLTEAEAQYVTDNRMVGLFMLTYTALVKDQNGSWVKALVPTAEVTYEEGDPASEQSALLLAENYCEKLNALVEPLGGFARILLDEAPGQPGHVVEVFVPIGAVTQHYPSNKQWWDALDQVLAS